jgi:hypothetical protein
LISPTTNPLHDFFEHFKAADGMNLSGGFTVRPYQLIGDMRQTVVCPYGPIDRRDSAIFEEYPVQIAVYIPALGDAQLVPSIDAAEAQCRAIRDAYKPFDDDSSANPGLTFGAWGAYSLSVHYLGYVESIPITGGYLIKAVCNLRLRNLHPIQ